MPHALETQREAARTRPGQAFTTTLCVALLLQANTCVPQPLPAAAGLPEYQEIGALPVPGGARVNVMGGNLLLARTDLTIDTQLGPFSVGATWNSTTRAWRWSFDGVQVQSGTYTDATGWWNAFAPLPNGATSPGTHWVRVGYGACQALEIKTKGGLQHDFRCDGRPLAIHWSSSYEPYLRFNHGFAGDGLLHTTGIDQCLAAGGGCHPVYTFSYDAQGRVTGITDRAGRTALFSYDASGRLTQARDGLDVAKGWPGARYGYASNGDLTSVTNSEGERVVYAYDGGQRVASVRQIGLGNPTRTFAYEGKNANQLYVTRHVDALGHETRFRYDADRQLREVEAMATGEVVRLTWTASRRWASLRLPDGATTSWSWANDDIATRTDSAGNVMTYSYAPSATDRTDPVNRPIVQLSDALGVLGTRSYDAAGRLITAANGAGETVVFAYGADQMLASTTTSYGVATSYAGYGEHGHPTQITVAGATTEQGYDAVGNLLTGQGLEHETSPGRGGILSRSFDEDRNLRSLELVDLWALFPYFSDVLTIERRSDGRPTRIVRPFGGNDEYTYDALGRVVEQRERSGGAWQTTTFTYDLLGRPKTHDRPNGMSERWIYDPLGRVTSHTFLRGGVVDDTIGVAWENGRIAWSLDQTSGVESYDYDAAGRLNEVLYADGSRQQIGWDVRSRLAVVRLYETGGTLLREIGFGYDAAGRERLVSDGGTVLLDRSFAAGRLTEARYGNGLTRSFSYDPAHGRLAGTSMRNAAGATVESTVASLFAACAFAERCVSATTTTYGAAAATTEEGHALMPVRLDGDPMTRSGLRVGGFADAGLSYDELGNLLGGEDPPNVYDAEHTRLQTLVPPAGPAIEYTYDEAGFAASRAGVPITWDGAGRIESFGSTGFDWDTRGRLVSSTVAGVTTTRRFGGLVEASAAGTPTALDLGEVRIDLAAGTRTYRHFDFRGNVRLVSNEAGEIITHNAYSSYGPAQIHGSSADPMRFALGKSYGDLVLLGHRLYDPQAARFLAPDPIHQIVNQYAYAQGNPVELWDPSGAMARPGPSMNPAPTMIVSGIVLASVGSAAVGTGARLVTTFPTPQQFRLAGYALVGGGLSLMVLGGGLTGLGYQLLNLGNLPQMTAPPGAPPEPPPPPPPPPAPPGGLVPQLEITIGPVVIPSCAPAQLADTPGDEWALFALVPLQLALGALLLYKRRRWREKGMSYEALRSTD